MTAPSETGDILTKSAERNEPCTPSILVKFNNTKNSSEKEEEAKEVKGDTDKEMEK